MEDYILNEHNKEEFPPAHTAEHLLNQVMQRMFGCERSSNAHIERKKSKISWILERKPDRKEEQAIARQMNELIEADLPVTFEFHTRAELEGIVFSADEDSPVARLSLDRLPEDASETIRLVRIGDFDVCPCIGKHVRSTAQIAASNCWVRIGIMTSVRSGFDIRLFRKQGVTPHLIPAIIHKFLLPPLILSRLCFSLFQPK